MRDLEATLAGKHKTEITTVHTNYKNRHLDLENQINSLKAENQLLKNKHHTHVRSVEEKHTSVINDNSLKYEN